ncbi:MAG: DNA-binding protein [Clostridia bacterium]|nr:DNA-binding protein [Clostridia bacterium]
MDKLSFITLWDAYGGLLTAVQQEITDLYFNKDLTVSEIAEQKGISRQAVSDCLKGCKKQLEEYEEKLRVVKRLKEISLEVSSLATDVSVWAENFITAHPEYTKEISELQNILNKD